MGLGGGRGDERSEGDVGQVEGERGVLGGEAGHDGVGIAARGASSLSAVRVLAGPLSCCNTGRRGRIGGKDFFVKEWKTRRQAERGRNWMRGSFCGSGMVGW